MLSTKTQSSLLMLCFILASLLQCPALRAQKTANNYSANNNRSITPSHTTIAVDSFELLNDSRAATNRMIPVLQNSPKAHYQKKLFPIVSPSIKTMSAPNGSNSLRTKTNLDYTICHVISGRNFLMQDSLMMWTGTPCLTADGNVIVSGEYLDYAKPGASPGGFCMKTDVNGKVIWAKLYDSAVDAADDYINYFQAFELRNRSILLAGRTTNKVSNNDDFMLTKLDENGNMIWTKTYASKFWQGFNGSGDYFALRDLKEDSATGEIYFVNSHWGGTTTITKLDPADGHVLWSNGYHSWDSDYPFGIVINSNNLLLFQLENGYYNDSYIDATIINKVNGDTISSKHYHKTGDVYGPALYNTFEAVQLNNGHFLLSGPTTHNYEYPTYTGTIDLYHAGIIELDENLDFVKAYGFKNRIESNNYNTRISLYPDGTGVFTMFKYISSFTGESEICLFRNEQIYHQRKRIHINEGLPFEPRTLQMADGGFLNIKLMGDSTKTGLDGARIDYYRMHTSDTSSLCLGIQDTATSLWYFNYEPVSRRIDSIHRNVFTESRVKTLTSWNFMAVPEPACQVISHCDSLQLEASTATICPGNSVTITTHKDKECGSLVPLVYDTSWVSSVRRLSDTTYSFSFAGTGKGYIKGSLLGCTLKEDSVLIEVLPARHSLDLGKDTVICPGNQIRLNAGSGFKAYQWQDGSADSTFVVTMPGNYFVMATNSCGAVYHDTIKVADHPPIPFNAGADRIKCNSDTIHLNAPPGFLHYTWSNPYNISSLNSQSVVVDPLTDTAYYVKAEKEPGCFAYDTVRIKVLHSSPIDLGRDSSFCFGDAIVLDAGSGFQDYEWSNGATTQAITVNTRGVYSIAATTAQGCKSYDTLQVLQVYALPLVQLDKGNALCTGETKTLDAGMFSSYLWQDGSNGRTLAVNGTGRYFVTVIDNKGCKGSDTVFITTINPQPKKFLPADTAICSYGSLELKAAGNYKLYSWSTGGVTPAITITQPGTYWLEVQDDHYCKGKDSITIYTRDCLKGFYIPTAFTPNGDGKNDVFRPMLFGQVMQYHFAIYNRYGQVVYQTSELQKGWNGKTADITSGTAVFAWMCTYQFEGETVKVEKGTVTVVR